MPLDLSMHFVIPEGSVQSLGDPCPEGGLSGEVGPWAPSHPMFLSLRNCSLFPSWGLVDSWGTFRRSSLRWFFRPMKRTMHTTVGTMKPQDKQKGKSEENSVSQQVLIAILMQGLIITRLILFKRKTVLWSTPPPTAESLTRPDTVQGLNSFGCCDAVGWDPKCLLCDREKKQELGGASH